MANQTNVDSTKTNNKGYTITIGSFDMEEENEIVFPPERSATYNKYNPDDIFTLTKATDYNIERDNKGNVLKRISKDGTILTDKEGREH